MMRGGNELNHVIVREAGRLLPRPDSRRFAVKAAFAGWSADNDSFYLVTTERNQIEF